MSFQVKKTNEIKKRLKNEIITALQNPPLELQRKLKMVSAKFTKYGTRVTKKEMYIKVVKKNIGKKVGEKKKLLRSHT